MLQTLQTVVELEEFAQARVANIRNQGETIGNLIKSWDVRFPSESDAVSFAWDDIVENRRTMFNNLSKVINVDKTIATDLAKTLVKKNSVFFN